MIADAHTLLIIQKLPKVFHYAVGVVFCFNNVLTIYPSVCLGMSGGNLPVGVSAALAHL